MSSKTSQPSSTHKKIQSKSAPAKTAVSKPKSAKPSSDKKVLDHKSQGEHPKEAARLKSMGKKQLSLASAITDSVSPPTPAAASLGYQDQLPKISHVAGSTLQADIQALNQAVIRLLKTAARLGPVEPLAPLLLGTSPEMIEIFEGEVMGERLLAQSLGFPLVQLRIHDVGIMRQMLSDGIVSASSVQSITHSFPLEVIEAASRRRGGA